MADRPVDRISLDELMAEGGTALPPKEVISLLNLNVDLDLVLDLAAPIDLAVAANANAALPINASVSANVGSLLTESAAAAQQDVVIDQAISGEAIAHAPQQAMVDQGDGDGGAAAGGENGDGGDVTAQLDGGELVDQIGDTVDEATAALSGGLLNIDVHAALDADIAAPIAGAVAANANVAAPINASVSANVLSVDSVSAALADQTAVISQNLDGVTAEAVADQDAEIIQ